MKFNDYQKVRAERLEAEINEIVRQQNAKIEDTETQLLDTQEGVVELYNMISGEVDNNG